MGFRRGRRVALVTGGSAGIGFFIARGLAERGANVIITGRDAKRGEDAVAELRTSTGAEAHWIRSDASLVRSNVELADDVLRRVESLDILVNNVGIMTAKREETAEGLERVLATDFVGPVALTTRLLPLLRLSKARVVQVVSSAFGMVTGGGDPFDDVGLTRRPFVGIEAYARAKLFSLLFVRALARRESEVLLNAVNPGMAWNTRQ